MASECRHGVDPEYCFNCASPDVDRIFQDMAATAKRNKELEARIHELEAKRNCPDGSCGRCGGCYEVMREEFNRAADERDKLQARVKVLETSIVGAIRELQDGKDYTPLRRLERALVGKTTNGAGQMHKRHDGQQCSYMAETFCNKCGWFANE